jgi:Protein of unknown function (DUF2997)
MQKVVIRVSPKGEVLIEGQGIVGVACMTKVGPFAKALGQVVKESPTGEMFQEENAQGQEISQR